MTMVHAYAQILVPYTHGSQSIPIKPTGKEKGRTAAKKYPKYYLLLLSFPAHYFNTRN